MTEFTATEKRKAAMREVNQRRHVYPKLVQQRKMTPQSAEFQIAIMQSIADDYRAQEQKEKLL